MSDAVLIALVLQLAATSWMCGVILVVHRLVYPTFARVTAADWRVHHDTHTSRITPIVLPAMAAELATAIWLLVERPPQLATGWLVLGVALVALTWAVTVSVSLREHTRLGRDHDAASIQSLLRADLVRAVAWLARMPLAAGMLLVALTS